MRNDTQSIFHTVEADGTAVKWPEGLPLLEVESGGEKLRDIRNSETGTQLVIISGELNKLAANISIGRNMAGVHYYTDYYESLRMGERVLTGVLLEHLKRLKPARILFKSLPAWPLRLQTRVFCRRCYFIGYHSLL